MGLTLSNPTIGGAGSDNIEIVADIAARDALSPDSDIVVKVTDASADATISAGVAWYQWNGSTYDLIAKGESSKPTAAELAALINSIGVEFVGGATYTPASVAALETDYPAASNSGKWCLVTGLNALDGFYKSDGTLWQKKLDDSGDRSNLFSYAGGVSYGATNLALGETFVSYLNDLSTTYAGGGTPAVLSELNDSTIALTNGFSVDDADYSSTVQYCNYSTPPAKIGKLVVASSMHSVSNRAATNLSAFAFVGILDGVITEIVPTSVSATGDTEAIISGTQIQAASSGSFETLAQITVLTSNNVAYDFYGIRVYGGGTGRAVVGEIELYAITAATDAIDCVTAINTLNARLLQMEGGYTTLANVTALNAITGQATGDRYEVTDSGDGTLKVYEWNGSAWVDVTATIPAYDALVTANQALNVAQSAQVDATQALSDAAVGVIGTKGLFTLTTSNQTISALTSGIMKISIVSRPQTATIDSIALSEIILDLSDFSYVYSYTYNGGSDTMGKGAGTLTTTQEVRGVVFDTADGPKGVQIFLVGGVPTIKVSGTNASSNTSALWIVF